MKYMVVCKLSKKNMGNCKKEYKKNYKDVIIVVDCEGVIIWN